MTKAFSDQSSATYSLSPARSPRDTVDAASNHRDMSDILVGESRPMRRLRAQIARIARTDLPVLIQGESGTGKELVATALHHASRRSGEFVAFNVCAIPDALFESSLFGHVRGAFTGATCDSAGYLAEADRGTVFLDEIGALSLPLQAKLLRAIETRAFRPVGGRHDRTSNFRVAAATNAQLDTLFASDSFRSDLAHRLGGDVIAVPPLREHVDDIPALVQHFLSACSSASNETVAISREAVGVLQDHVWPGNVRELRHVVHRLIAYSEDRIIHAGLVEKALRMLPRVSDTAEPSHGFARSRLIQVLEECGWRDRDAATVLSVHPTTIFRWRKAFGIQRPAATAPRALIDEGGDAPSGSIFSAPCSNAARHCSNDANA